MQELEHDYKALLKEAISDSSNKEKMGLAILKVVNDQIKVFIKRKDGLSYKQNFGSNNKKKNELD